MKNTSMDNVTRVTLAENIEKAVPGLSSKKTGEVVDNIVLAIVGSLAKKEDVKISGFGKFSIKNKSKRKGRNPQTGAELIIKDRCVVKFKASDLLKLSINDDLFPSTETKAIDDSDA